MRASAANGWREREVELGQDGAALRGTLALPPGDGPAPAALILAGSGPVDRDGNLPGLVNDSLKRLAPALTERGIATLRVDKRGIGGSAAAAPREDELRFGDYVADAVAWLELLRAEPRVEGVVAIGHSEGALVATLAARPARVRALVLVAGAGAPAGALILRQLAEAGAPQALIERARDAIAAVLAGREVGDLPDALAPLFRPSVRPYLASWLPIDPAAELAKVDVPTLVVRGTTDLQASEADARRLAAARAGIGRVEIVGMNHVLKPAPPDREANLATYGDPDLDLTPGLVDAVASFVLAR